MYFQESFLNLYTSNMLYFQFQQKVNTDPLSQDQAIPFAAASLSALGAFSCDYITQYDIQNGQKCQIIAEKKKNCYYNINEIEKFDSK